MNPPLLQWQSVRPAPKLLVEVENHGGVALPTLRLALPDVLALAGVEVWSHVLVVGLDPLLDLLVKLAEAQANAAIDEEP